jgi:hypothetical protein
VTEDKVKRYRIFAVALCFAGFTAWAAPKDQSLTGWISDSKCGAKGANAGHAACAKKCIDAGEKPVLVTDKDQKIVAIANPDAISADVGQHVEITGSMTSNGSLHVDKAQARP